jgi:Zn/Cd-binding protein ZinT
MKYSNFFAPLFATLLISAQIQAQTATSNTTTVETSTNGILLDNAAKSQQYQQQSGNQPSNNPFLKGSSPDAVAARKANLTDQEKQLVDNYVDQAGANKM